jgi:hypothetical protein
LPNARRREILVSKENHDEQSNTRTQDHKDEGQEQNRRRIFQNTRRRRNQSHWRDGPEDAVEEPQSQRLMECAMTCRSQMQGFPCTCGRKRAAHPSNKRFRRMAKFKLAAKALLLRR